MNVDKLYLKECLEEKKYEECIDILNKEIKNNLIEKIQEKDKNYEYVNLPNLRSKCLNLLDDKYISITEQFCELHTEEIEEEYLILILMKLLKELQE